MDDSEKWVWVYRLYNGEKASYVRALENAGIGYHIRSERGSGAGLEVEAANKWLLSNGPVPEHLEIASEQQSQKLDALEERRRNQRNEKPTVKSTVQSLKSHPAFKSYLEKYNRKRK